MKAYHFVGDKLRDGRPVPADGEWLVHEGPLIMCKQGLHFSRDPFDALRYAPGPILCVVEVEDYIEEGDKGCAKRRKIIKRVDATEGLRYFARMQALSVVHLWDAPDVALDYLMTGDESIQTAAWDAAEDASWTAAEDAARAAARAAAEDAARAAAREATWDAARAAARAAAEDAARAAARAAAEDGACSAAGVEFNNLVKEWETQDE